ncbi:MAG: ribosome biogenesis GTPase Der [Fibrobacterota bacterium]
MKELPVVAIIGAPNVGKSTLFNRIIRKRIAVIDDRPGVTRDRNYIDTVWNGVRFTLIDTGGIIPDTAEHLDLEVNRQVEIALEEADVLVYMVDAQCVPSYTDIDIAEQLKRTAAEKIILAVNKADNENAELSVPAYWELGVGEPCPISAAHGKGVAHFLDKVVERIRNLYNPDDDFRSYLFSMSVIGRPNAGKSSLVNALLKSERTIVSETAGTTRDSIDTILTYGDDRIKVIDTAGLRKKARVKDRVEYYANLRSLRSIYRSDVCVLMIDTTEPLTQQDMRVIRRVKHDNRGMVIIWNKWDLIEKDGKTFDALRKESVHRFPELANIPMLSVSALTGQRVHRVLQAAHEVYESLVRRVSRYDLERCFKQWVKVYPHPYTVGQKIKFFSIKQEKVSYPHFIVFCTNPHRIQESYINYLRNKIIAEFDFAGTFVKIDFRLPGNRGKGIRRQQEQRNEGSDYVEVYTV